MDNSILKYVAVLLILVSSFSACTKHSKIETHCKCEEKPYYYCYTKQYEKVFLDHMNDWLFVGFYPHVQNAEITEYINQTGFFKPVTAVKIIRPDWDNMHDASYSWLFVNTKSSKTCSELKEIIYSLKESSIVAQSDFVFLEHIFRIECPGLMWSNSQYISVTVKDKGDLSDLYTLMQETNTWIDEQLSASFETPTLFWVVVDSNSKGNTRKVANYFHESEKLETVTLDFVASESCTISITSINNVQSIIH